MKHAAIILISALLLIGSVNALAEDALKEQNACRMSEFGRNHSRGLQCLSEIVEARADLDAYDELLLAVPPDQRDSRFRGKLTEMRCGILNLVLTAYFHLGEVSIPLDVGISDLYEYLVKKNIDYSNFEMPDSLDQLVQLGYLHHLPESPYSQGEWLNSIPDTQPTPGSILYMAIKAKSTINDALPGENSGWILMAFGNSEEDSLSINELNDGRFWGRFESTYSLEPSRIIYLWGQDDNTIEFNSQ